MTSDELIVERLELIQATLALAFSKQIADAASVIRSDEVCAAILDMAADWIESTDLQTKVAAKTKKSSRTVRDRLPDLLAQRVLASRGSERRLEYKRTGLI